MSRGGYTSRTVVRGSALTRLQVSAVVGVAIFLLSGGIAAIVESQSPYPGATNLPQNLEPVEQQQVTNSTVCPWSHQTGTITLYEDTKKVLTQKVTDFNVCSPTPTLDIGSQQEFSNQIILPFNGIISPVYVAFGTTVIILFEGNKETLLESTESVDYIFQTDTSPSATAGSAR